MTLRVRLLLERFQAKWMVRVKKRVKTKRLSPVPIPAERKRLKMTDCPLNEGFSSQISA
jgi:hypothetical protein